MYNEFIIPKYTHKSFFSSGKPKEMPRFMFLVLLGLFGLIFIYKWFQ